MKNETEWQDSIRWLRGGTWAILDQSLFALSNFAINLCLARWLTPSEYGAFATVFMILLMFGSFHSALIIEPMIVFSSSIYKERFHEYLSIVISGHWILTVCISALTLLAGAVAWHQHSYTLAVTLAGLALASPMILYQWFARRVSYVKLKTHLASYAGIGYLVLMSGGTVALYQSRLVTGSSILLLMGFASFGSGLWLLKRLVTRTIPIDRSFSVREVLSRHWGYGKFMVGTNLLSWSFGNGFFILLPVFAGFEATGAARALLLTFMPMFLVVTAISHLLLPVLMSIRMQESFGRVLWISATCLILASTGYSLVLGIFSADIIQHFFAGQYGQHTKLLWILGMLPPLVALVMVLGVGIRAIERPDQHFSSFIRSSYVALPVGLILTVVWGIVGAVVATVFAHATLALFLFSTYDRLVNARATLRNPQICPTPELNQFRP